MFPFTKKDRVKQERERKWQEVDKRIVVLHYISMMKNDAVMDSLRREARKLEQSIEMLLHDVGIREKENDYDKRSMEIERELDNLQQVINKMERCESANLSVTKAQIDRWKLILIEFRNEFRKTHLHMNQRRESAALFGQATYAQNGSMSFDAISANELFHRERSSIASSMRGIDNSINQAISVKDTIKEQTESLKTAKGKVSLIAQGFSSVNELIRAIGKMKTKNNLIVAGAIALSIVIILWMWLPK